MKTFRFRLHAVLTLREEAEQQALNAYAQRLRETRTALQNLQAADDAVASEEELVRTRLQEGVTAYLIEELRAYGIVLKERRETARKELVSAQQQAEAARQNVLKASRDRKALEKLRSRQRLAHAHFWARAEQKELDEIAGRSSPFDDWGEPALATL